jgi:tRNA pseudouridine38-40 synthase
MHYYKMRVAYLGTSYQGWQIQAAGETIQALLERALGTIIREPVRVVGASRTDAGVHADGQVCAVKSPRPLESLRALRSLRALLPEDVAVLDFAEAEPDFHPIRSAKSKVYCYRLWLADPIHPLLRPIVWRVNWSVNLDVIRRELESCRGRYDFEAFCSVDASVKTTIREIFEVRMIENGPLVELWFRGEGFLKQMIRSLTGTLIDLGTGRPGIAAISDLIAARDRSAIGRTAPASGLTLVRVLYDESDLASVLDPRQHSFVLPLP